MLIWQGGAGVTAYLSAQSCVEAGKLERHKPRSCSLNHQSDDSYCTLTLLLDVAQILG